MEKRSIVACCHVCAEEADGFVGIRVKAKEVYIYFPRGYKLQNQSDEKAFLAEFENLIRLLARYSSQRIGILQEGCTVYTEDSFPIYAYMRVVRSFLANPSYYCNTEDIFRVADRGKIDWKRSMRKNVAFYQPNGMPFFRNFTICGVRIEEATLITQIHRYCVYEAFRVMGWFYHVSEDIVEKPLIEPDWETINEVWLPLLNRKIAGVFNDRNKQLMFDMREILSQKCSAENCEEVHYGTKNFECVWEGLINDVFAIPDKEKREYFPTGKWHLWVPSESSFSSTNKLRPDTIMRQGGNVYILDAKYYKYGVTFERNDFPPTDSIHKQITYGEYVEKVEREKKVEKAEHIFNAFLMPYNMENVMFAKQDKSFDGKLCCIGYASGPWLSPDEQGKSYAKVHVVLVDIRSLMMSGLENKKNWKTELAGIISNCAKNDSTSDR